MKLRRALRASVVGLAGVVMASTLAALPAEAAKADEAVEDPGATCCITRNFEFRTQFADSGGDGAAKLKGLVRWHNKREFDLDGIVNDLCPGDGWGAIAEVDIFYKTGSFTKHALPADLDGCKSAASTFDRHFSRERRITEIWLIVAEHHTDQPSDPFVMRVKDNPYVAG
ncbi:MAG: hypothetical protein ACRDT8_15680 [Micromonosporaceae bacterium]